MDLCGFGRATHGLDLFQDRVCGGPIDAPCGRQCRAGQCCVRGHGLKVAAGDLRGEVVHRRLLRAAGNVFETEPVLEAIEGLLDASALVITVA